MRVDGHVRRVLAALEGEDVSAMPVEPGIADAKCIADGCRFLWHWQCGGVFVVSKIGKIFDVSENCVVARYAHVSLWS